MYIGAQMPEYTPESLPDTKFARIPNTQWESCGLPAITRYDTGSKRYSEPPENSNPGHTKLDTISHRKFRNTRQALISCHTKRRDPFELQVEGGIYCSVKTVGNHLDHKQTYSCRGTLKKSQYGQTRRNSRNFPRSLRRRSINSLGRHIRFATKTADSMNCLYCGVLNTKGSCKQNKKVRVTS